MKLKNAACDSWLNCKSNKPDGSFENQTSFEFVALQNSLNGTTIPLNGVAESLKNY